MSVPLEDLRNIPRSKAEENVAERRRWHHKNRGEKKEKAPSGESEIDLATSTFWQLHPSS
jgi:hypothetical protein